MMFNSSYNNLPAGVFQTFISRPDLRPPLLNVNGSGTPGLVLFTQAGVNVSQPSLVIADNNGDIVYVNPDFINGNNFNIQSAAGEQYLTFWNGTTIQTHGQSGTYYLMDRKLNFVHNISLGEFADAHEFQFVAGTSTALHSFFYPFQMNLTKWGGPADGYVYGTGFQHIDLFTGKTLFEWRSTDHVSPDETNPPVLLNAASPGLLAINGDGTKEGGNGTGPWDYFHINSVDAHPTDGSFLISARHSSSLYKISGDPKDKGKILWTLTGYNGLGKKGGLGDFSLGPGVSFEFQHHARWHSPTEISLFDDGSLNHLINSTTTSRALRLKLAFDSGLSASLIEAFVNPTHPLSGAQGSFQYLSNGNYWVDYGDQPLFAEYSPSGELVSQYEVSPPGSGVMCYRAFKANFTLQPQTKPDITVQNGAVYMSWNGATEVNTWAVYTAKELREEDFKLVGKVKKLGFETKFVFPAGQDVSPNYTIVDALDGTGKVIGTSQIVTT